MGIRQSHRRITKADILDANNRGYGWVIRVGGREYACDKLTWFQGTVYGYEWNGENYSQVIKAERAKVYVCRGIPGDLKILQVTDQILEECDKLRASLSRPVATRARQLAERVSWDHPIGYVKLYNQAIAYRSQLWRHGATG